jgi:thiol-disulfide isomerase/thioredoxin
MVTFLRRGLPLTIALILLLTGCAETPSSLVATDKGSTTFDNTITEIKPADRGKPITFGGPQVDGSTADSTAWLGSPVVVNFWYAGCPPCRAEAPDLAALDAQFRPEGVVFVGVNVRDEADTAAAFAKTFGIEYESILDVRTGAVQLAFAGQIAPNAVPTTLVLDRQGRVAARIIGRIPARSILQTLIQDTLDEGTPR